MYPCRKMHDLYVGNIKAHKIIFVLQSDKVKQIRDIWHAGLGVVTLHVFQNTIPVEAYTREAAMILALGKISNFTSLSLFFGILS